MKKSLAVALVIILALFLLAACEISINPSDGGNKNEPCDCCPDCVKEECDCDKCDCCPPGGGSETKSGNTKNPPTTSDNKKTGPFANDKFTLPENVYFIYESTAHGNTNPSHIAKIGNDFYHCYILSGYYFEDYYKYLGNNKWRVWYKTSIEDWTVDDVYDADVIVNSYVGETLLNFMTSSWYYNDMKKGKKLGTESVAGVMCEKYSTDEGKSTIYYDPVTNLFFKAEHDISLYEIVKWDTSIISFESVAVSKLPE